jgi:hypothetical protein
LVRQYYNHEPPHELLDWRCSDDTHQMRWRNIVNLAQLPWVNGRHVEGQAVMPAAS